MSSAQIIIEDDGPGVAVKAIFTGGYDPKSPAHQAAQILIGLADEHLERIGAAVVDATPAPKPETGRIILAS